ncbi:MAG: hypothetical protein KGH67_00530, partial [Candidatus Micrarchaeota archaeon]|nr:hypothetical protein [Candidatus Micrarchaeota archaeon]
MPDKIIVTNLDTIKNKKDYSKAIKSARSAVFFILFFSFVVFVAIAIYAVWQDGLPNFVKAFESINLVYFVAALAVILISYSIRFPK